MATVWTFSYGSFINRDVLAGVELVPERIEVARLPGFDIRIEPIANLVRSDEHTVYGILMTATHAELDRLYEYARSLGGVYLPEPVIAQTLDGTWRPALVYLAAELPDGPVTAEYVDRILGPAREYGFPGWYLDRLAKFRPA